jgi:hypothetical protein
MTTSPFLFDFTKRLNLSSDKNFMLIYSRGVKKIFRIKFILFQKKFPKKRTWTPVKDSRKFLSLIQKKVDISSPIFSY